MPRLFAAIAFIISSFSALPAQGAELCPHVQVESQAELTFTALETKLACGDPKDPPWSRVPRNQARYMLGTFLQARGFYRYHFRDTPSALVVEAGEPTLVSRVEGLGIPDQVDLTRYWLPAGRPLTPKLLDDLERWVKDRLKAEGYACPKVETSADPAGGRILVTAEPGLRLDVKAVEEENVEKLVDAVLRRYDAFAVGALYDDEEVQLTARRTLGKQLLLSTHFTARCDQDGVVIRQKSLAGPPRLASIGFGFNTEELFLIKGSLRNTRLGPTGSILDLTLRATYRQQELGASSEWYVLPYPSRFFLRPEVNVTRVYERRGGDVSEARSTRAALSPATTFDSQRLDLGVTLALGPALTLVQTVRGEGPDYSRIASVDGQVEVRSHLHEYYATAPRTGFQTITNASLAVKEGSTVAAHRFAWSGSALYNVLGWDPPKLVGGVRAGYATTITGGTKEEFDALPVTYRRFLGGSQNVRGFPRRSIPDNDGGLTTAFAGTEARVVSLVPYQIEPLAFVDVGLAGEEARYVDPPYYWSPGIGVRWQSPIGPMRLTAARGFVRGEGAAEERGREGYALYFSFGEEF